MRQPDRQRHEVVVVAAGVAEHHALVPRALGVEDVFVATTGTLLEGDVDAVGDVGALLVERDQDAAAAAVESHGAVVVADVDDGLARQVVDVDVGAGA